MSNPLMGAIGGAPMMGGGINPQMLQQIKQAMNTLRTLKNPQQAIMQAAQQNPQLNAVLQMCNGRDPKAVFYDRCQQMGVDPEMVLSQLR